MNGSVQEDTWVTNLREGNPLRERTVEKLRELLLRGLHKSMHGRYSGGLQPDDVAQEAVLKILDSLDSFQCRSKFTTWAMTIATRIAISELRKKHYSNVSMDSLRSEDMAFEWQDESHPSAATAMDRKTILKLLLGLVESALTAKQKTVIQGTLSGLPVEEIARRMDSNRNAIYKLLHDARLRLKSGFEKAGFQAEDLASVFA